MAPAIVVPSAATARDLLEAFAVDEARVHVVHHGVEAEAFAPVSQAGIDAVRRRHGIPGGYVLFVGGIEPRKNLELLVRAFAESDAQAPRAGDRGRAGSLVPGGDRAIGRGRSSCSRRA